MFTSPYAFALSSTERTELEAMVRSRVLAAGLAQRARVILAIADGEPYSVLGARVSLSTTTPDPVPEAFRATASGWIA